MSSTEQDELYVYLGFLEAVRDFNQANATYLEEMHRLEQNNQMALRQAARDHLDPLLNNLRYAQVISGAVTALSIFLFCGMVARASDSPEGIGGIGVFVFLLAIVSGAVFVWTSQRVSKLVAKIKRMRLETRVEDRS